MKKVKKVNSIPVIIINDKDYMYFMNVLKNTIKYSKFKNIEILNSKFIISNKGFKNQNHINIRNQELFAECNNIISEIYSEKDYKVFESKLKGILPSNVELNDFIEEWIRTVFNIISEYLLFVLQKKHLYFFCKKCQTPSIFIKSIKDNDNQINKLINNEDKKKIISKIFSLGIANLLYNYMDYDKSKIIKFNNLINKILYPKINDININNNNISLGNPPQKKKK